METRSIDGIILWFDETELEAAEIIGCACTKSVGLLRDCWSLSPPRDCHLYVMTCWKRFMFNAAPPMWRIALGITLPLWRGRVARIWRFAGGWAQRFGKRQAVGVKPPRLIQAVDSDIGARLFVLEDLIQRVQMVTCHELTHVFTSHLRLPMWLNEGLAMVTVDRFFRKQTVREETLEMLTRSSGNIKPGRYWRLRAGNKEALLYHFVRGYWLTRYLQEVQPELLKDLLTKRYRRRILERMVGTELGMNTKELWRTIDGILAAYFCNLESKSTSL